jgi:phosphatidate cytidylyltransferase
MLGVRVASAVVLVPLLVAVALLGEPWLSILIGLVLFLALVELIGLLDAAGFEPPQVLLLTCGLGVAGSGIVAANGPVVGGVLAELLRITEQPGLPLLALAAAIVVLGLAGFTRSDPVKGFASWGAAAFGLTYVALLGPFIVLVGHLGPSGGSSATTVGFLSLRAGTAWILLLALVVWGYDTGAYLTGRWIGRRRLVDHISPSKTVEGLAGGLVLGTIAAGVGCALVGLPAWHPLVIGPLIGLTAQAGDLAESMLKRAAGRKESGFLVPGHGGILDRLDSFLFAAPMLTGYALLITGAVV